MINDAIKSNYGNQVKYFMYHDSKYFVYIPYNYKFTVIYLI